MNRLSFDEYRHLVEQAPILIWRADTTAGCDYFNERWLEFTGRTLDQERGNGWAEGVHPEDFQRCLDIYMRAFGRREAFEMNYRLRRNDGEYRWIFDRGVPFCHDEGTFAGYIGSCIDVTDKVEGEAAIRRAQELEVRHLRGLLPICANCKRIRDDGGYWHGVEKYIHQHSDASFSHGLCPPCIDELFPDLDQRQREELGLQSTPEPTSGGSPGEQDEPAAGSAF